MKKFLKISITIIVALSVLIFFYLTYTTEVNRAVPGDAALAALTPTESVAVADGEDWLVMRPKKTSPGTGFIHYPGANCDIHGYAQILQAVADAGYLAVGVAMPFDFSIFDPNAADDVRAAFPEIQNWVIAGHSMGGAMAGRYAYINQDNLAGLILYDSYPPEAQSLADSDLPTAHIFRATLEEQPHPKFIDMAHVYPPKIMNFPVPGGIHMQFGTFIGGGYEETWAPQISNAAQLQIAIAATLKSLASMQ